MVGHWSNNEKLNVNLRRKIFAISAENDKKAFKTSQNKL